MTVNKKWQPVIGLEVHVQLNTRSKIFSGASVEYGADANTQACDVSIALPGTLPVMNIEAARLAVRFGLAINAQINRRSVFARKHYFYPDLPKGYQISQYEEPIVGEGDITIVVDGDGADDRDGNSDGASHEKTIGILRAHLEEDAGKSLHEDFQGMTGIDLNRAGTPLLEIVSHPQMHSSAEAVAYLRKVHTLVRYLDISDGNMQEGSFRCDANVSVKPVAQKALGTRTEIKNINSFRFVDKAIQYEIARQIEVLEGGGKIIQETRLYDETRDETRPMRSKEEAHDYRYFPDPDLPALVLDENFIAQVRDALPELPDTRAARFQSALNLSPSDAAQLTADRALADYFEAVNEQSDADAKTIANWMLGALSGALNKHALTITHSPVTVAQLATLLNRIADQTISGKIAKDIFDALWRGDGEVDAIIDQRGLRQITDTAALEKIVDDIIAAHVEQVAQYQAGGEKVLGFLVGQAMKQTGGKANPQQVNALLREKLGGG